LRSEDHLESNHHIHAVRGTLTRDRICGQRQSVALGDPGLLADRLIEPPAVKRHPLGVIPHLIDHNNSEVHTFLARHPHAALIDVTSPVRTVLETIAACERVLSSSLHGLVFADALGVPNAWFTASDRLLGGRHKFDDYYSAFDLAVEPVRLTAVDPDTVGSGYARPGIDALKSALVASFPHP
jgi:hypothetical protein